MKDLYYNIKKLIFTIGYCFKLSWRVSKTYTSMRILAQALIPGLTLSFTFLSANVINLLVDIRPIEAKYESFVFLCAGILATTLGLMIVRKLDAYAFNLHNLIFQSELNIELMTKALQADVAFFDSAQYQDSFVAFGRDIYFLMNVVWNAINLIGTLVTFVSSLLILIRFNFLLCIVLMLCILPTLLVGRQYTKRQYKWSLAHIYDDRKMTYYQTLATDRFFVQEVRLFNIGNWIKQRYLDLWQPYFLSKKKLEKKQVKNETIWSILPEIATVLIIIYIAIQVLNGQRPIGDYALYSGILTQFSAAMLATISAMVSIYNDRLHIDNVKQFESLSTQQIKNGDIILSDIESIDFENVSFQYPETDAKVLNGISFHVGKGEKICLVGVNGAGKTTIIKLLLRFYDVTEGQILINGINISCYDIYSLRKNFSCYLQQIITYSFSIRENIMISNLEDSSADDYKILEALNKAEALEIVEKAPKGLDTYLTPIFEDDGLELSGGQRQRISLARTFYRDSSVLVLDEPSAALDPEAEYRIFKLLEKLYVGKTTVFTSHRLSNVLLADRILLIENGKIIEQGTHNELMAHNGRYTQLFNYQAEKYNNTST